MANFKDSKPTEDVVSLDVSIERLQYLLSVYRIAIVSAGIGIFYYDVDRFGKDSFEANDIYADMLGLTPDNNGYYPLAQFQECLLPMEEEVSKSISTTESLNQLMQGTIEGTSEEIIKVRHLQTNQVKYLISSSRIDARFEDGSPRRFGGSIIDITERIEREKNQLMYAFTDELTRLPNNRKLLHDMPERKDGIGLFFDLDNFKKVNDTYGHNVGDDLLRVYGKALKSIASVEEGIYPYRLHGDEFFVFLEGKELDFGQVFERDVNEHLDDLMHTFPEDVVLEASMGYSVYTVGMDIDDFIKKADYKMYQTKIAKKEQKEKVKK